MDTAQGAMSHLGLSEHRTAQVPGLTGGHLLKDGDFINEFIIPPTSAKKKKKSTTTPSSPFCFSEGITEERKAATSYDAWQFKMSCAGWDSSDPGLHEGFQPNV